MLGLDDVRLARERIASGVHQTPLYPSRSLSVLFGCQVYLKAENLQRTGSFKIRGATNKLALLSAAEKARGVIAASAGNHAQGVALAARQLGIAAVIVMPRTVSLPKLVATRGYGARVVLRGHSYDEAFEHAQALAQRRGYTLVHAYDDPAVIAGQSVLGLEVMEQAPDLDVVLVPAGGGGLLAGVALAVKASRPDVAVIGVQSEAAPALSRSFASGRRVQVPSAPTVADGIAVATPGRHTLPLIRRYVDSMVTVNDEAITQAMVLLLERAKLVVEGAGAAALAALVSKKARVQGKKVVVVLSGGNVDTTKVAQVVEHGLVHAGRYLALRVPLHDRPGQLALLMEQIARAEGNVLEVEHHRRGFHLPFGQVEVEVLVETRGSDHANVVVDRLHRAGYSSVRTSPRHRKALA